MRKVQDFEKISDFQTNLSPKIKILAKKVKKNWNFQFLKKIIILKIRKITLLVILCAIYRKSNNIIDFMNCSKSQSNVNYKFWLIKLLSFMWAYGWKNTVCFRWHCRQIKFSKYISCYYFSSKTVLLSHSDYYKEHKVKLH